MSFYHFSSIRVGFGIFYSDVGMRAYSWTPALRRI